MKTNPFILGNLRGIAGSFKQYFVTSQKDFGSALAKTAITDESFQSGNGIFSSSSQELMPSLFLLMTSFPRYFNFVN